MKVKSFRDLEVWKLAIELVGDVYSLTADFPEREKFGLTNQIRRSAVSVPSNIAEGSSRRAIAEYARFVNIASGSLAELETQLLIAKNLKFLKQSDYNQIMSKVSSIGKMLYKLYSALEKNKN